MIVTRRYQVTGEWKGTGKPVMQVIEAESVGDAMAKATDCGIVVHSVKELRDEASWSPNEIDRLELESTSARIAYALPTYGLIATAVFATVFIVAAVVATIFPGWPAGLAPLIVVAIGLRLFGPLLLRRILR